MNLNPITRVCLQTADGYYSLPWDETMGLVILPGTGVVTVTHNGVTHTGTTASFDAPSAPDPRTELAAALFQPLAVAKSGDDLAALIAANGFVEVRAGHYPSFDVTELSNVPK